MKWAGDHPVDTHWEREGSENLLYHHRMWEWPYMKWAGDHPVDTHWGRGRVRERGCLYSYHHVGKGCNRGPINKIQIHVLESEWNFPTSKSGRLLDATYSIYCIQPVLGISLTKKTNFQIKILHSLERFVIVMTMYRKSRYNVNCY
jgi:hypothetical protein